jgi:8-oxo-dGTP pyrophosphatase MutT (NUDIX family)
MRIRSMRLLYRMAYVAIQLGARLNWRASRGVKCLLTHDEKVLLVKHTYGLRDVWYLPGGNIRRAELPREAAAREMREELGLSALELEVLATVPMRLGHVRVTVTCLHASLEREAVKPDPVEIAQTGWFESGSLPERLGPEVKRFVSLLAQRGQT